MPTGPIGIGSIRTRPDGLRRGRLPGEWLTAWPVDLIVSSGVDVIQGAKMSKLDAMGLTPIQALSRANGLKVRVLSAERMGAKTLRLGAHAKKRTTQLVLVSS